MGEKAPCSTCTGQTAAMYYDKVLKPITAKLDELDASRYRSYYMMKLHSIKLSEEQQADYDRLKELAAKGYAH